MGRRSSDRDRDLHGDRAEDEPDDRVLTRYAPLRVNEDTEGEGRGCDAEGDELGGEHSSGC